MGRETRSAQTKNHRLFAKLSETQMLRAKGGNREKRLAIFVAEMVGGPFFGVHRGLHRRAPDRGVHERVGR